MNNNQKTFYPGKNNHSSRFTTIPLNQKKQKTRLVVKIVWGTDKIGSTYIFLKMKDLLSGNYFDKTFILLYQSDRICKAAVAERLNKIINFIKTHYNISVEPDKTKIPTNKRKHDDKKFFFIKGLSFNDYNGVKNFYTALVKDLAIKEIGNHNIDENIFVNHDNYLLKTGILNYMK